MQDIYGLLGQSVINGAVAFAVLWCLAKSFEAMMIISAKAQEFEDNLSAGLTPRNAAALLSRLTPEQQVAVCRKLVRKTRQDVLERTRR